MIQLEVNWNMFDEAMQELLRRTEINVDSSDKWITEMSKTQSMIEPFSENQVRLDKEGKVDFIWRV